MRRSLWLLPLLVITLAFVVACGGDDEEETATSVPAAAPTTAAAATTAPVVEDLPDLLVRDVFFFKGGFTPPLGGSFFEHRTSFQMFEGLTAMDTPAMGRGESPPPVPNLAESWTISDDGRVYTFKIRPGIKFTTGRPLTGEAVQKSLQHTLDALVFDGTNSRYGWHALVDTIEAIEEMTVRVTLSDPYSPLIAAMTAKVLWIVDVEELMAHQVTGDKGPDGGVEWGMIHSAGTGPFFLEEWLPEQRLTMRRNPDYWGGHDGVQPSVERIIFSHIPENATAELMIGAGEVDVALQLDPISLQSFDADPDVEVFTYPSMITCNFLVDRRIPALVDDRGFQAIRYAIDYEGMRDIVALGMANIHQSLFLPGMIGHDPAIAQRYTHDPERAKALLAEIGYPDGYDVKIQLRTGACGSVPYQKALEFFQNNLAEVGIRAEIEQSTSAKFWGAIQEGGQDEDGVVQGGTMRDFGISGLGTGYFDPDNVASIRATGECFQLGLNEVDPVTGARLTELANKGAVEGNAQTRETIYKEMSSLMVDKCGLTTVLQVRDGAAHGTHVSNLVAAPHTYTPDFRYIKKEVK